MKRIPTASLLIVLSTLSLTVRAQDNNPPTDRLPDAQGGGERQPHRRPPMPLIFRMLDANHDGYIDADEMAKAPAVLKALDKNGDGKVSLEEALGPRPQRPHGEGEQGGPGQDGPDQDGLGNGGGRHGNPTP